MHGSEVGYMMCEFHSFTRSEIVVIIIIIFFQAYVSESPSNMDASAGPYYYHVSTERTYSPPPLADMTAAANLFPQALQAPA